MLMFIKLLELFILRTIFNKNEYKINSKEFNPIKFFTIITLVGNFIFTIYLIIEVHDFYTKAIKICPQLKKD